MKRTHALKLRALIEQLSAGLEDRAASRAPEFFPRLKGDGALVRAKTRIYWNGNIKRAAVDLWDTAANTPDAAPALWEDIAYREGERIIPAVIPATLAFAKGERGWWDDVLYASTFEGNTYTPEVYPAGWEVVEA